jgi:lysozyme family protein
MKDTWPTAIEFVLVHEGGLSIDPDDSGGTTKYGISQKAHPGLDIKNLTREQAETIYKLDYWNAVNADSLPWPHDLIVFDTAVNCGRGRALTLQQESFDWKDYLINRMAFYRRLGKDKYIKGWVYRVLDLYALIKSEG